jgi:RNA polymerase sigma factor (sigma-70 family)
MWATSRSVAGRDKLKNHQSYRLSDEHISEAKAEARAKFRRLTWFMSGRAKTPKLERDEELRLIKDARRGCKASVQRLAESHSNFIAAIAERVAQESGCPHFVEDMFSTAFEAFFRSVARFDTESGARLNTFSRYAMVGKCRQYALENKAVFVRGKGSDERKAWFSRRKILAAFKESTGRAPTDSDEDFARLSELSGIPVKALKRGLSPTPETVPAVDVEIVSAEPSLDALLQRAQASQAFAEALEVLRREAGERNFEITNALRTEDNVSFVDLGKKHGISAERVGQIVRASAGILRRELAHRGIENRSDLF